MLMTEFKPNRYEVDLDRVAHYNQDLKIKTLAELIHNSATRSVVTIIPTAPFWAKKSTVPIAG